MTAKRTLIRGGQVYDHDGDVHKPAVADILIEGDTIAAVGADLAADGADEVIDASRAAGRARPDQRALSFARRAVPRHVRGTAARILAALHAADGREPQQRRGEGAHAGRRLECLRCGITTVQDMLGLVPLTDEQTDVVIDAYREAGIRVVFSPMVWDIPPVAMMRARR